KQRILVKPTDIRTCEIVLVSFVAKQFNCECYTAALEHYKNLEDFDPVPGPLSTMIMAPKSDGRGGH
ncbi:unnamed protein product, partial [Allacma fusca]